MAIRGELFTNQVNLDNRSYFFNVKENRKGDVFLQIVESKLKEGQEAERRDIVVFADDLKEFLGGMEEALGAIDKIKKERTLQKVRQRVTRKNPAQGGRDSPKRVVYRRKGESRLAAGAAPDTTKPEGRRLHIVSKRKTPPKGGESGASD